MEYCLPLPVLESTPKKCRAINNEMLSNRSIDFTPTTSDVEHMNFQRIRETREAMLQQLLIVSNLPITDVENYRYEIRSQKNSKKTIRKRLTISNKDFLPKDLWKWKRQPNEKITRRKSTIFKSDSKKFKKRLVDRRRSVYNKCCNVLNDLKQIL
ncbi:hypothetical protein SNEBB_010085 [Seison nebaliae]|nr:hypothetical protein SNEBB_010085 [Seison nebaliae]